MKLFTKGQKDRMRTLFEPGGFRESLLHSPGLGQNEDQHPTEEDDETECSDDPNCNDDDNGTTGEDRCSAPFDLDAYIQNDKLFASWEGDSDAYGFEVQLPGSSSWFNFTWSTNRIQISNMRSGQDYKIRVNSICGEDNTSEYSYFDPVRLQAGDRISDNDSEFVFEVSPNPATDRVQLNWYSNNNLSSDISLKMTENGVEFEAPNTQAKEVASVTVFNVFGQNVWTEQVSTGAYTHQINVNQFESGIYLVVLRDQQNRTIATEKLMVKP